MARPVELSRRIQVAVPGPVGPQGPAGPAAAWGGITGTLATQSDLQAALDAKVATTRTVNGHALSADVIVTKGDLGLGNVENTALSTWGGSATITTVGTLATLTVTAPIVGSVTGNAATATALQTARAINGVSFDGTAAITVAAAAGTVTGATLAANVLASSLTSLGTIASLQATLVTVQKDAIAAVSTDGLVVQNTTAATAGVPVQQSPRIRLRSNVWNTTATAANNTNDWWVEAVPVSGTIPSCTLKFGVSLNGGATFFALTVDNGGNALAAGNFTAGGNVAVGGASSVQWAGKLIADAPAAKQLNLSLSSIGIGLDFATDAVLKIRTRAQTGYATVDALAYKVSGVAGVNFGPAAITSITIVNGIVTAAS